MKIKSFLFITIMILSLVTIRCSQSQSPFTPDAISNKAVLNGTFVVSDSITTDLGEIQVGVEGTSLYTSPDMSGNFQIDDLPIGDIVVEVYVQSDVSDIKIDNVKSGEEILITIEIQSNNQAILTNMERNNESSEALQVEIQPSNWNLNWENNEDEVIAKISGDGYDQINPDTVQMGSPDGSISIESYEEDVGGVFFIAKFHQNEAITLIADPQSGESYDIHIIGEFDDGEPFDLLDTITIVGNGPDMGELSLDIRPDHWNAAWTDSTDEVNAMISGDRYDSINHSTVEMIGPDGATISPYTYEVGGVYYIAKFYQNEAITLIADPQSGESHDILVIGEFDDGESFELSDTITIVGKED